MMIFGTLPYRATAYYGEVDSVECNNDGPIAILLGLLEKLKQGERQSVKELIPYLIDESFDIRQYSQQLFAHTCTHSNIHEYEDCLNIAEDEYETARIAFRLGETLSLSAIPLLIELRQQSESAHVKAAVEAAIRLQLGNDFSSEHSNLEHKCRIALDSLDHSMYYYHGNPVFIGDVCKEFVAAALVANQERNKVVLIRQSLILANSSGLPCPVQNGEDVGDNRLAEVFNYVQRLASMEWKKGAKYFYHFEC
jgi:hypothetical protein